MEYSEIKNLLNATEVKTGSQHAKNMHHSFYYGDCTYYLGDVYGRYSNAKAREWERCREWCYSVDGKSFRICSHNTSIFTVGFIVTDNNDVDYLVWITPSYNYITRLLY